MSPAAGSFYQLDDTAGGSAARSPPRTHTAGPWSADAQHGGPPMALMAREAQRLGDGSAGWSPGVTCDLLGPVPVGRLRVEAVVARPGRSVELVECELADAESGRVAARAAAWLVPRVDSGPVAGLPTPPSGVDSASGASTALDITEWQFMNTELTAHLVREPAGEWIGLRAHTTLGAARPVWRRPRCSTRRDSWAARRRRCWSRASAGAVPR